VFVSQLKTLLFILTEYETFSKCLTATLSFTNDKKLLDMAVMITQTQ